MALILVSGAAGIIGSHTVKSLLSRGHSVVALRRRKSGDFGDAHPDLEFFDLDLLAPDGPPRVIEALGNREVFGFVHLARSRETLNGPESSPEDWLREYKLSTVVPFFLARQLYQGNGLRRVILASSIYGQVAQRPHLYASAQSLNPSYGAAKAAVSQLVRDMAVQFAPQCQVNAIAWGGLAEGSAAELRAAYERESPSRAMLKVEEAVAPIISLLDFSMSGITGQTILVDGGWTAW